MKSIRSMALVGLAACAAAVLAAEQRWLGKGDTALATDGNVNSFTLPQPGSGPATVAIATDGSVWFTEGQGNRIGRIRPDGSGYQGFPLPNPDSAPRIIAPGSDGNMWFSEHGGNRIGRITPQGVITEFPLPTPDSGPRALAAGPDGNIWYSAFRASRIGRITPQGEITEFVLPRPASGPGDITAGADGAMWFLQLSGTMDGLQVDGGRIGRITMDGVITEYPLPARTPSPINITVGPDRNIWYTRGGAVGRVTPDGRIVEYPLEEGARGSGLSAGSDRRPPDRLVNRLYVADSGGNRIAWLEFAPQGR